MEYPYSRIDPNSCTEKAFNESTQNGSKSGRSFAILLSTLIWTVLVSISGYYAGQNSTTKHAAHIERKWALGYNLDMPIYQRKLVNSSDDSYNFPI